jgi:hypothetical protein
MGIDAETPVAIGFQSGLYWAFDQRWPAALRFSEARPVGQGSAMVMPYDSQQNIFRWNHAFLPAHVRCWTDPSNRDVPAYPPRRQRQRAIILQKRHRILPAEAATLLRDRFGLAPLRIRPQLARLHGKVPTA